MNPIEEEEDFWHTVSKTLEASMNKFRSEPEYQRIQLEIRLMTKDQILKEYGHMLTDEQKEIIKNHK